jgi:hypothetical protein
MSGAIPLLPPDSEQKHIYLLPLFTYLPLFICIYRLIGRILNKYTVEPPFNLPSLKVFPHLTFSCRDLKSVIAVLNDLHLRFSSVWCSGSLVPKETSKRGFTVYLFKIFPVLIFVLVSPPSVSQLSRKCGSLYISQP